MKKGNWRKGFTMVELITVMAIISILAAMSAAGLTAYIRAAQFRHNEENAKTVYLVTQTALSHAQASDTLDPILADIKKYGDNTTNKPFTTGTDAASKNARTYAIKLNRGEYGSSDISEQGKLVVKLLDDYTYDKSLFNAAICLEIDVESGDVYSAFYAKTSRAFSFTDGTAATDISDRSYANRRQMRVGYYSSDDLVNTVSLDQQRLKVRTLSLLNNETLTLNWSGNSRHQDLDVGYTISFYNEENTEKFSLYLDLTAAGYTSGSNSITVPVTVYDASGKAAAAENYTFPLTYQNGKFTLTLDAMEDAQLLYDCTRGANAAALTKTSFYSITRFISDPENIYAAVQISPNAGATEEYTVSSIAKSNTANTLFDNSSAAGSGTGARYQGEISLFRHLYNIRWMSGKAADFTVTDAAMDWTGGQTVVYTAGAEASALPILADGAAAFPTVPSLGANQALNGSVKGKNAVISNLRLRTASVAQDDSANGYYALYCGLFGENDGAISNLTLQDADVVVNLTDSTDTASVSAAVQAAADSGALASGETASRTGLRGVGALCGLSLGTVKNVSLTQSKNGTTRVAGAVYFDDIMKNYSGTDGRSTAGCYVGAVRGIGGIVGICRPAVNGETAADTAALSSLSASGTVTGLLLDGANSRNGTAPDEKTQYANAAFRMLNNNGSGKAGSAYLPGGIGGITGFYSVSFSAGAGLTNAAAVRGNMLTGGVAGSLMKAGLASSDLNGNANGKLIELAALTNTGLVRCTADYNGAKDIHAGQFAGGISGYAVCIKLTACKSSPSNTGKAAYIPAAATLTGQMKGDFVGGLVGYATNLTLGSGTGTGSGYVLGHDFVGGFVGAGDNGGLAFTDVLTNGKTYTNASSVLGHRYVGGITALFTDGTLEQFTNTGVVAGFADAADKIEKTNTAAYVGGIVGKCDGSLSSDGKAIPVITECFNAVTDTGNRLYNQYSKLGASADYVGGIAGYFDFARMDETTETVPAAVMLVGRNFVGGIAGYVGADTVKFLYAGAVTGQIYGSGDAVGGYIGLNRSGNAAAGAASIKTTAIIGRYCVGGVIGANILDDTQSAALGGMATANTLGTVRADGICGGVIGYVRCITSASAKAVPGDAAAKLLPSVGTDKILTDSSAVTDSTSSLDYENAQVKNTFTVRANAYAGGILGASAKDTRLMLRYAVNSGEVSTSTANGTTLSGGAGFDALLGAYGAQTLGAGAGNCAAVGGIVGVSGPHTAVRECTNMGVISGAGNGLGGISGVNFGAIVLCANKVAFGTSQQNYVGGVVGVNACAAANTAVGVSGSYYQGVADSSYSTATVAGGSYVGGVAGINLTNAVLSWSFSYTGNTAYDPAAGVAASGDNVGGVVGENQGTVELGAVGPTSGTMTVSGANNVGGVAGHNTSAAVLGAYYYYAVIQGDSQVRSTVRVSGTSVVGGVIGRNEGSITPVVGNSYLRNYASVDAAGSYAGGIVGLQKSGTVSYTKNYGRVHAADSYAGGIVSRVEAASVVAQSVDFGNVVADNGIAGGIAASNAGTVMQCAVGQAGNTVSISAKADYMGVVTAENAAGGVVDSCTLDGSNIVLRGTLSLSGSRLLGGLAGSNAGTIQNCTVSAMPALSVNTGDLTVGGAAGGNAGAVKNTGVTASFTGFTEYLNLGGVAGSNTAGGTLVSCTYSGTITEGTGGSGTGHTIGGIVGDNMGRVESCSVGTVQMSVGGTWNVNESQDAATKLLRASHTGGIAGKNEQNAAIVDCTLATGSDKSVITAVYGFLGGIVGSNQGTIAGCGGSGTKAMVTSVAAWLSTADANEGRNAMVAELTKTSGLYTALKGIDEISDSADAGNNQLRLKLGASAIASSAAGYAGGVAGYNTPAGLIKDTASGKWFVYGQNLNSGSAVGGMIGQNESEQQNTNLVNCAATRFYSYYSGDSADLDTLKANSGSRSAIGYPGGVIGIQYNTTSTDWALTNCVNYGSVFASRSNDVGGVIARWAGNGGTLENCFNFGALTTNSDAGDSTGGTGTVGGIVAYIYQPANGININLISCQNHGEIRYKSTGANDCAGILGKVVTQSGVDSLTINIVDCVNGQNAVIYGKSLACGIFAWLGGGNGTNTRLNIDRCRNYSVNMYAARYNGNGTYYRESGIYGCRNSGNAANGAVTNITNCFALYHSMHTAANNTIQIAPIAFAEGSNTTAKSPYTTGSGNYYMDALSFTYAGMDTLNRENGAAAATLTYNGNNYATTAVNSGVGIVKNYDFANWFDGDETTEGRFYTNSSTKPLTITLTLQEDTAISNIRLVGNGSVFCYAYAYDSTDTMLAFGQGYSGSEISLSTGTAAAHTVVLMLYQISGTPSKTISLNEIYVNTASGARVAPNVSGVSGSLPSQNVLTTAVGGQRLFAGADTQESNTAKAYFGAQLSSTVSPDSINMSNTYVASTDFSSADVVRQLVAKDGNTAIGALNLLYGDNDGSGAPNLNLSTADPVQDVTDETIQAYYAHVLDAKVPGMPQDLTVQLAQQATNVYGRYNVSWTPAAVSAAAGSAYAYQVTVRMDGQTEPLLQQIVYQTSFAFEAQSGWAGKGFSVEVKAINTRGMSAAASLGGLVFVQTLPTPELKVVYDKQGSTGIYSLVLENAADYAQLGANWKVTAYLSSAPNTTYTLTSGNTTVAMLQNPSADITASLRASAVATGTLSNQWMESAQFSKQVYIPKSYPSLSMNGVTWNITGTNVSDLSVGFTLLTSTSASQRPIVRVALTGTCKSDAVTIADATGAAVSLKGQRIMLAQQELAVTGNDPVTFDHLPEDILTDYTDFRIVIWTAASGLGPVYYYQDIGEADAAQAVKQAGTNLVLSNGYQILRAQDGTNTCLYSSALANAWTSGRYYSLNITALAAPVLQTEAQLAASGQPVIDSATNQMSYSFAWTGDTGAAYAVKLTGITTDTYGNTTEYPIDISAYYTDNTATALKNVNADGWNYDSVRLQVSRLGKTTAGSASATIGNTARQTYAVVRRMPRISTPSISAKSNDLMELVYTVSWQGVAESYAAYLKDYAVYGVADGKTVLLGRTTADETSLDIDMEAYAGKTFTSLYVVAEPNGGSAFVNSPIGMSITFSVPERAAIPSVKAASITDLAGSALDYPLQSDFENGIQINLTANEIINGNFLLRAYFFSDKTAATEIAAASSAAAAEAALQTEITAGAAVGYDAGNTSVMTIDGTNATDGTTSMHLSLANLDAANVKRYVLLCLRAAPTGSVASNWVYAAFDTTTKELVLQMPGIQLDAVSANALERTVQLTGESYVEATYSGGGTAFTANAQMRTVEWQPVAHCTQYVLELTYDSTAQTDGRPKFAKVTVDEATGGITAVQLTTCATVAEANANSAANWYSALAANAVLVQSGGTTATVAGYDLSTIRQTVTDAQGQTSITYVSGAQTLRDKYETGTYFSFVQAPLLYFTTDAGGMPVYCVQTPDTYGVIGVNDGVKKELVFTTSITITAGRDGTAENDSNYKDSDAKNVPVR